MEKTGLQKAFLWMIGLFAIIMVFGCEKDPIEKDRAVATTADTIIKPRGYDYETSIRHYPDTLRKVQIADPMISSLNIWRTTDGQRVEKIFDNEADPKMEAYSKLAREDYNIKADQLNILPSAERTARAPEVRDSDGVTRYELDTVYYAFPDAQVLSIPIKITNRTVVVANFLYQYASLTFDHAEFVHLRNTLHTTRAVQIKTTYNTEYKVFLYFKETNVVNPRILKFPIYAYTTRYVLSDDEVVGVHAENKLRELLDSLTERCSFDRVTTYKSGEVARDNISIILQHKVAGIDPYSKVVDNFNHQLTSVNGIVSGPEAENRTEGKWTVWRRTDGYSANIENGVAADKVVTDYSLMHERCCYKEYFDNDSLVVIFGYENYRVSEKNTTVTPRASDRQGQDEALLDNHINATYMGLTQDVSEFVFLYKPTKAVTQYDFENPSLVVFRDSVVGNIDFIRYFNDGTKEKIHDHINVPKSLICNTNWESIQRVATQVTDSTVQVNLVSAENASEGYWRYQRQNRNLLTYATLYDGTSKQNAWTSIVPNLFVYTREGQTYTFRTLDYAVAQNGASLNFRGEQGGFSLYDYKDDITVMFDTDTQRSTAPGLVKINGQEIVGYDIRNKQLIINPDNVVASLDFITKFANGTESKDAVRKEFPRSLTPTTDWTAYENDKSETTAEPQITSMQKQSKQTEEWYWDEETRTIAAAVKLASSSQYNGWTSVDPNNIRFTREGIMADFGKLDFNVIKINSNVSLTSAEALRETYRYSNTISVSYGSASVSSNMKSSTAPGTIVVQRGREVTGHEFRNPQLVITDDYVTASLTYVTLFNDGTENTEAVSHQFSRGLTPYTNWTSIETSNTAVTGVANVFLSMTNQVADGNWSYANETRDITTIVTLAGSSQKNGWTSIDPNSIKYTRDGQTYDFGNINFKAEENGQNVSLSSSAALQDIYSYFDKIRVVFGNNTKASQAPGTIYVQKSKQVSGYEIRNPQLVVNNDFVTASLTFVTLYNDGTEDQDAVQHEFPRTLNPYTNWTTNESNANEQTSSATTQVIATNNANDGEWSYVNETHRINTTATLSGSTQTNGWNAVEPNDIVFTRNGKQHKFNKLSFSATESGHSTSLKSSSALLDVYSYTDKVTVTYGGNSKSSTAPGTINVQKSKQVSGYEIRNPQLVVNSDNVVASLTFVTLYNDGSEDKDAVQHEFPRSLNPYTDWTSTEANANEQTGSAGTSMISSSNQSDGEWTYTLDTHRINTTVTLAGSTQTNGWNAVEPNNIVYTRNGKQHKFNKLTFAATESGHGVSLKSSAALLDVYSYTDKVTVTYGGNSKSSTAPGTINVQKAKQVSGYEIRNPQLVVNNDNVVASLTFVTLYNDGSEDKDNVSKDFARSLEPYTNWTSTEANANEQTGSASTQLLSSNTTNDGEWSYMKETHRVNTTVTLSGSTQTNGWNAVEPNEIVFTRNGKQHKFNKLTFAATESGHGTTLANETALSATYNYVDQITVTYGSNSKSSKAPGTINVKKEKQVTSHEFREPQLTITDSLVTARLTYVTIYNDGSEDKENVSKRFSRKLNPYTNWASTEKNSNEQTGSANVSLTSSNSQNEGNWSYVKEIRDIKTIVTLNATQQTNGWTAEDPNSIKYTRDGQTYDFGTLNFSAAEAGHNVKLNSETSTLAIYDYKDKISVTFGSNTKYATASGTINVEKEIVITGYEISNQKIVVEQNSVTASLTYTTVYSDGTKKNEDISKTLPRSFTVKSDWSSNEANNSQSTGTAIVTLTNSKNKTDGDWKYVTETRSIKTTATLAGSTQDNKWESVDPNNIVFSRNGKTYSFNALTYNATEKGATVNQKSSNANETVYSYTDKISVSFGSNSFNSSAPGTITVAKPWNPDFPESYGKFKSVAVTATENEGHNSWVYAVSIHFEHGTLPLIIRQNASAPDAIDNGLFTTSTDSKLNSAYYLKSQSKWVNAVASDESQSMVWKDINGNTVGMLVYSTATVWGWDDGHQSGGHPTVFTDKYSAKLSNNNTVLTIYNKSGNVIKTYKSAK